MRKTASHNLTHQLAHNLGASIVKGEYQIDQGLPSEAELCLKYQVSRSATREAVKMLSAKGLIASRPKQGIKVLPESHWNMYDGDVLSWILKSNPSLCLLNEFIQLRLAIEPQAAILVALNASTAQITEIEKALDRMIAASHGLDEPIEAMIAFHMSLLQASGNRFIAQLIDFIAVTIRIVNRYSNQIGYELTSKIDKYQRIFSLLQQKKPTQAENEVKALLTELANKVEQQLISI